MSKLSKKVNAAFNKAVDKGGRAALGATMATTALVAIGAVTLPLGIGLPVLGVAAVAGSVAGHKMIPRL